MPSYFKHNVNDEIVYQWGMFIPMFTRILLASDGSDDALCAARYAGTLARQFGAMLIVVYVSTYPDIAVPPNNGAARLSALSEADSSSGPMEQFAIESARVAIERTKSVLNTDSSHLDFSVREYVGDPADTILITAEQEKVDLILLGCGDIGVIKRLILGSVAAKVSQQAYCSVLIVRAEEAEEGKLPV